MDEGGEAVSYCVFPEHVPEPSSMEELDAVSVEIAELSCRAARILRENGITTLGQFIRLSEEECRRWPGCGPGTALEIMQVGDFFDGFRCKLPAKS